MGKATDFKFGRRIHKMHLNKILLKFLEKSEREGILELAKFFKYPLLSEERVKLRSSNFACTFIGSIETPLKISEVAVGVVSDSRKFSGHPYMYGASRGHLCGSSAFLF